MLQLFVNLFAVHFKTWCNIFSFTDRRLTAFFSDMRGVEISCLYKLCDSYSLLGSTISRGGIAPPKQPRTIVRKRKGTKEENPAYLTSGIFGHI